MSRQIWKGGALIAPLPAVLISCKGKDRDEKEAENVFTVAWTGIINTVPPKTYISVRKSRYSYDIIKNSREFVINIPTAKIVREVDYCGIYTGGKVDKFEKCGFTKEASNEVSVPCIGECPLCLECRVTDITELGTHDMFIADIVCTNVRDDIISSDGKLRLEKAGLMAFAHGEYFELGKRIGEFGFSTKKKGKYVGKVHSERDDKKATPEVAQGASQGKPMRKKSTVEKAYEAKKRAYTDKYEEKNGKRSYGTGFQGKVKTEQRFSDFDIREDIDIDDDVLKSLEAKGSGRAGFKGNAPAKKSVFKGGKSSKSNEKKAYPKEKRKFK